MTGADGAAEAVALADGGGVTSGAVEASADGSDTWVGATLGIEATLGAEATLVRSGSPPFATERV